MNLFEDERFLADLQKERERARAQLDTFKGYFETQSRWITEEEKTKYEDAEQVLQAVRERVRSHPKVEVVTDVQSNIIGIGEYDRVDIALAARVPVYTEDEMNDLALEVFEGFYDPEEYHYLSKPIGHGLTVPVIPDLLLSNMNSKYERRPEFLDQELGFRFPSLVKRLPLSFAEQHISYNISGTPSVPIPADALEELARPQPTLYKPFLWRTIVVTLFPDANVAQLSLAWEEDRAEKARQAPRSTGFQVIGLWEMPELKDWGIDSISHGIHFEIYRRWREGKNLVKEYFPNRAFPRKQLPQG